MSFPHLLSILQDGGIIAYPTEAVYGLGCDPYNDSAIKRLLEIKQRPRKKGLIIIAAKWEQCEPFVDKIPEARLAQILASWPGPYTWLFPAQKAVSQWLRGDHSTIAIRITNHPIAKALSEVYGQPLVSTSANIEGQPPAKDAETVVKIFGNKIDWIVPGSIGNLTNPTEIRDALTGLIIRSG